jgi:hypothetical protein
MVFVGIASEQEQEEEEDEEQESEKEQESPFLERISRDLCGFRSRR